MIITGSLYILCVFVYTHRLHTYVCMCVCVFVCICENNLRNNYWYAIPIYIYIYIYIYGACIDRVPCPHTQAWILSLICAHTNMHIDTFTHSMYGPNPTHLSRVIPYIYIYIYIYICIYTHIIRQEWFHFMYKM